ncbi:MAG TPA: class I SAM-dependent methyltransferase [Pyrinomonadaceae bacterium]|jgi:methyltransferase (TIGR00027 family)
MKADAPSATAYLIASSTLFVAADPAAGRLVSRRAAELSASFIRTSSRLARLAQSALLTRRSTRPFVSALERLTLPGIQLHYALRKRYLEETTRASIAEGFHQVVVFGAGYDTLALRLCEEFPHVRFIEIDHPATQRRKTEALAADALDGDNTAHRRIANNLHFLPLDLTRRAVAHALNGFGRFDPVAPTLYIAEGLLMYLAPREVDELFQTIRDCRSGKTRARFAFTFMEQRAGGRVNFLTRSRAVDAWLNWRREVFKWGVPRAELPGFLAARGFAPRQVATEETFRRLYLEPARLAHLPLAVGEYICVADREGKDEL